MKRFVAPCVLAMGVLAAVGTRTAVRAAQDASPPNIVILFVDDLGYGDIGPFGATLQKTPHLDRMAREGMKLTSFYAAPVCSVSRAQLLTGCYGARVSVPGVYPPGSKNGLHPREVTIAERLKERGYATQCIGKWHVGDQPEFLPTRQGFDHYFGLPYSNDMQRRSKESGERVVPLVRDERVQELLTEEGQSGLVERYTDEALGFIDRSKESPFFLYLAHTAVHTPIHPGPAFRGKSRNGRFGDWVEEVDWSTGKILDRLTELKLDRKTLVVFTSDNGPWLIKGPDGGSAGPLRAGKGSTWEGGVREPTLMWWPGRIAPGTSSDVVAGTIDLLPTAVKLAGGRVPSEPAIDGRDLSKVLLEQSSRSPREAHYYFAGYNLQAVRQGPWKLALAAQPGLTAAEAGPDPKTPAPRLYNLNDDIGERTNVADAHPDVVRRLKALADRMAADIGGASPALRRAAGEAANPQTLYPTVPDPLRAGRPAARPADLSMLKPGDTVSAGAAPQVAGTAFTVSLEVETSQADGVLVAHGGVSAGYAVHLREGRVVFSLRTRPGEALTEIVAPRKISGRVRIAAALGADRTLSLKLNDMLVATGTAPGLLPRQPAENFCVGFDDGKPVARYTTTDVLVGVLRGLHVTIP